MPTRCATAVALTLLVGLTAQAQEQVKVTGRVVDAAGKPVAFAAVGSNWNATKDAMKPYNGATTDAEGRFTTTLTFYGPGPQGLLALDMDQKAGGLLIVEPKVAGKPVEIKLGPLVHVHGRFFCKELDKRPKWTNVYLMSGPVRFLQCSSEEASFSFRVPPGKYMFWGYGTDVQDLRKEIILAADTPDLDLKALDLPATIIARHVGKAPPEETVTDARGVKKDVRLADFKGKWVLVEFWGFW